MTKTSSCKPEIILKELASPEKLFRRFHTMDTRLHAVDRIVRPSEATVITGRSLASIWRDEKAGRFPQRVKIGQNAVGYRLSELMNWLDSRETVTLENVVPVAPGSKRGRKPRIKVEGTNHE
jgi:prophage regulatory protein